MTTGWKLDRDCRTQLLARWPARYATVVADHVTRRAFHGPDEPPPPPVPSARVVGRTDDDAGVEALVVAIDGSTARPDGGVWHITWSLAEGRHARESNDVLAARGWVPFDGGPLVLIPAVW